MKRVLVVEDDQAIREVVVTVLVDAGYSVASAPDGERGLAQCRQFRPDVVMLDLAMPVLDGREFLRRRSAHGCKSAVVVMSAAFNRDGLAADAGHCEFVEKPFEIATLLATVAAACGPVVPAAA